MKRVFVLLGVLALVLAACGTSGSSGSSSPAGSTASSSSASTASSGSASASASASGIDASPSASEATIAPSPALTSTSATEEATTEATGTSGALPDLGGREVRIGTDATYPPMEYVDPKSNQIVGFDVDLMNAIGQLINIKPQFQNAGFDTIFIALQQKQYDAVMSSATITEDRKKIVDFSDPYIDVGQLVVVSNNNTAITSYQNLATARAVGVQTGTTGETAARDEAKVPDANLKRYQTIDVAFADLANNAIDAVVADSPTVANYTSQPQYSGKLKIVGQPFTTESYGIAVAKGDTELLNAINGALAQLKADGTVNQLRAKYNLK